jgi:hypothetical protein
MEKEQPYKTSDQGFAAYLMLRGYFCAGAIEAKTPGRLELVFVDVPGPQELEDNYFRSRRESISARDYYEKLRTIKHIIHRKTDELANA